MVLVPCLNLSLVYRQRHCVSSNQLLLWNNGQVPVLPFDILPRALRRARPHPQSPFRLFTLADLLFTLSLKDGQHYTNRWVLKGGVAPSIQGPGQEQYKPDIGVFSMQSSETGVYYFSLWLPADHPEWIGDWQGHTLPDTQPFKWSGAVSSQWVL
jgi:hypothetical protein